MRAASPSPPSPPRPPRGALARAGARALRAGTRTRRAHPTPQLGGRGRCGSGWGWAWAPASGRGARSRLRRGAPPRVTGPGRRAGPPAGMRSCRAKKAPDVTCSQSARAARGQVTSTGAQLWVQMRGGGRGGRGAGLAAAALRPLPSPRTPAPALKGAARCLRPHLQEAFPAPALCLPCLGTSSPTAHKFAEGRADAVLREGPLLAGRARASAAPRPPPQPLFVRGLPPG